MTTISSDTLTSLTGKTADSAKKASDTYNQFLKLLTTQLKNQDPLDPMQSNEFTNQLVQMSQVEQGILTNEKLDTILSQANNNQIGQSLGYIGKDIYFKGSSVYYEGSDLKLGYAIDGDPLTSKMRILDKDNNIVRTISMPTHTPTGSVTWDGKDDNGQKVADGAYTLRIDTLDTNNAALKSYTGVPAHVEGVETLNGVLYLAINGDRRVEASTILSISEPDTQSTGTGKA